jgi:hypothetical protein
VREREFVLRDAPSDERDCGDAYEERTKSVVVERTKRRRRKRTTKRWSG